MQSKQTMYGPSVTPSTLRCLLACALRRKNRTMSDRQVLTKKAQNMTRVPCSAVSGHEVHTEQELGSCEVTKGGVTCCANTTKRNQEKGTLYDKNVPAGEEELWMLTKWSTSYPHHPDYPRTIPGLSQTFPDYLGLSRYYPRLSWTIFGLSQHYSRLSRTISDYPGTIPDFPGLSLDCPRTVPSQTIRTNPGQIPDRTVPQQSQTFGTTRLRGLSWPQTILDNPEGPDHLDVELSDFVDYPEYPDCPDSCGWNSTVPDAQKPDTETLERRQAASPASWTREEHFPWASRSHHGAELVGGLAILDNETRIIHLSHAEHANKQKHQSNKAT